MGRSCQFHWHLALQPQGVEHHHQTFKNDLYPRCNIQMRRNRLTSVLAYHPFHHVPREPVDEIFLSSLVQPKDNTAIQYLYLWFFNQTLGQSHLQLRLQRGFRSYMDPRERCKSDVFLSYAHLLRPKWCVMASFFSWLITSRFPLWSDMFAISWTILLQVSVLYAHRFMVSGFRVMLMISFGPFP